MEQTKNEPKNENKAAPDNGKPKKERKPLTEAQRLKRQKMIVLPAIVLVFIGAMWLIFAPSSLWFMFFCDFKYLIIINDTVVIHAIR